MKTPGLRAVAAKAGVARMTAARALRADPHVAPETRRRVLAAARDLGYKKNPLVTALMTQLRSARPKTYVATLGYLVPSRRALVKRSGLLKFHEGIDKQASSLGFKVDIIALDELSQGRSVTSVLRSRGVVGLFLPPWRPSDPPLEIDWSLFAMVAIGDRQFKPEIHLARNDQYHTARLAFQRLTDLGYCRIALQIDPTVEMWTEGRFSAGFAYEQAALRVKEAIPRFLGAGTDSGPFRTWFRHHRPDAIFVSDHTIPALIKRISPNAAKTIGIAHQWTMPEFSGMAGVDQRGDLLGAAAVDLLVGQLNRNERGIPAHSRTVIMRGEWVDGPSLI